ncbi:hypothetical protein HGRIS_011062 [Hohenbuehelia grisea]|uniref:Peptidase A2 domain-containing protein n=1 Tax=Hohenbuehelia grisea TaxID=104357 RepID=A0ABR3IYR7_9AGAR
MGSSTFAIPLLFDGGTVLAYLRIVKAFLDANPHEVLTLLFTNPEGASITGSGRNTWEGVFRQAGLIPRIFNPPSFPLRRTEWPTLRTLVEMDQRLIVFLDSGADRTRIPWILPEFQVIWETPFSQTNSSFPCRVDRTSGPLSPGDQMYLINHSFNINIIPIAPGGVIISDPLQADGTNGAPSIIANIAECAPFAPTAGGQSVAPNFVLIDFVGRGEAFAAADWLNGVG